MYQAGIKNITLYENKDLTFVFHDPVNLDRVSALVTSGEKIEVLNDQRPEFEFNIQSGGNRKILFNYNMSFFIYDLTLANIEIIRSIKESIYGFKPLIEFYDGSSRFYNVPLFCSEDAAMNPHQSLHFDVKLNTRVATIQSFYNYYTTDALGFKADTTIITADTTLYTADYE